jgi:hypothetical protein
MTLIVFMTPLMDLPLLEFDARSWCVRGRIDFVRKVYQRSCMTNVTLSLAPTTDSHTLQG